MIRKLKTLGLALVAVAAMNAVAASAAQASSLDTPGVQSSTVTGLIEAAQEHFLTVPLTGGGALNSKCTVSSFEGRLTAEVTTEAQVTATYSGCKVNGLAAIVRMNGCKYTLTQAFNGQQTLSKTVNVDVGGCTPIQGQPKKQIEVEQVATGCIVFIPEQTGLSHIVFTQLGNQLTASATVTNITHQQGAKCPNPLHEAQTASFQGNTIVTAYQNEAIQNSTQHGHQHETFNHSQTTFQLLAT